MRPDRPRRHRRWDRLLSSEESVYGLVLVAGMIIVSSQLSGHAWEAVLTVLATVIVFFAAHVYAGAVSRMAGSRDTPVRTAVRSALRHSMGMVTIAAIPLIVMALGAAGVLSDEGAVDIALALDVLLLGLVGWLMAAARTDDAWARIGGALVTAAFGGALIGLKVAIHL